MGRFASICLARSRQIATTAPGRYLGVRPDLSIDASGTCRSQVVRSACTDTSHSAATTASVSGV